MFSLVKDVKEKEKMLNQITEAEKRTKVVLQNLEEEKEILQREIDNGKIE